MASEARNNSYTNLADPNRPSEWLEKQQSGTRKSKFLVCFFLRLCLVRSEEGVGRLLGDVLAPCQVLRERCPSV